LTLSEDFKITVISTGLSKSSLTVENKLGIRLRAAKKLRRAMTFPTLWKPCVISKWCLACDFTTMYNYIYVW
jgi:hypothetical protein